MQAFRSEVTRSSTQSEREQYCRPVEEFAPGGVNGVRPKFRFEFRKSAAVSPTVVATILIIQKKTVISGTLFCMRVVLGLIDGCMEYFPFWIDGVRDDCSEFRGQDLGQVAFEREERNGRLHWRTARPPIGEHLNR